MLLFPKLKPIIKKERKFQPKYFRNDDIFNAFVKNGYVIISDVVKNEQINKMIHLYKEISEMDGFELSDSFLNSGRLKSIDIRSKIVTNIKQISKEILSDLVDTDVCEIETGGAFQIKPPSKISELNPHQDTPIVDENEFYAVYVWVPLCDTTLENGCLSVLPESHLWENHQRSLNIPWKYEKETKKLWKKMVDLPVKRGQLICFDSALIHASKSNMSNEIRLAFTCAILPLNFQLIHYYKDNLTEKNKVEVYAVDEFFFSNENITQRPASKYKLLRIEEWNR